MARSVNAQLRELSQLYDIDREIKELAERIAALMARADVQAAELRDMPRAPLYVGDKVGDTAAELVDAQRHCERLLAARAKEKRRLYGVIEAIEDSRLRRIYTLRFVEGLSWWQVAHRIGGGNTADSCRKAVVRHLEGNKKKEAGG